MTNNKNLSFDQLPAAVSSLMNKVDNLTGLFELLQSQGNSAAPKWFNIDELCEYSPDKPKKQTVYRKVSEKKIPFHKNGKKLFFLKTEIDEWLKEGRKKTASEISDEAHTFMK